MRIIIFLITMILMTISTLGFSTSLDDASVKPTDTLILNIQTTTNPEKGDPYVVEWYDNNINLLEADAGTLSIIIGGVTNEIYVTLSSHNFTNGYVNTTVSGVTQQIFFNITGSAGNAIIFQDAFFSPEARIGRLFAVDIGLTTVNNKSLNNAQCTVFGTDSDDAPLQVCGENLRSYDGRVTCEGVLSDIFIEGEDYLAKIRCTCGTGDNICFDRDGNTYEKYSGEAIFPFPVAKWLTVNTVIDADAVSGRQVATICANVTNIDFPERISLDIYYQLRCGTINSDTDRVVISANPLINPDQRGIDFNTTQNQCWALIMPEKRWMQGRVNTCYASTDVHALNKEDERIIGYYTTSPVFNVTIDDLGVNPDWLISGDNNELLTTRVNMSDIKYEDYKADIIGNIDLRLDLNTPEYTDAYTDSSRDGIIVFDQFIKVQDIKTHTVAYCNGTVLEHELEVTNEGFVELEVRNINLSTACIYANVTMNIYRNREVSALENWYSSLIQWLGWMTPK